MEEKIFDRVIEEVYRVLQTHGKFLVIDKIVCEFRSPSEELTVLTELAYHKAVEYVHGIRVWGVRRAEELIAKIASKNFTEKSRELITLGKRFSWDEFIENWGRDTLRLMQAIPGEARGGLEELVNRIKTNVRKYGYGPARVIAALFVKEAT